MSNKFENTEKVLRVNDPEKKYWLTIVYFPKYTLCRKQYFSIEQAIHPLD